MQKIHVDQKTERIIFKMNAGFEPPNKADIGNLRVRIDRVGSNKWVEYPIHEVLNDGSFAFVIDDDLLNMKFGRYTARVSLGNCCCAEFEIDLKEECSVADLKQNKENFACC
jgi:hypothetical protein